MRIFLDANILFSAAKSDSAVRRLLEELLVAGHQCVADGYVIGEARRNLERKYPSAIASLNDILADVDCSAKASEPGFPEHVQALPEKDRPVMAAAIHHRCQALITGDKLHFGALYGQTIGGVTIHSPRTIAEALLGKSGS
jgi:predicted nucleic acid-binding protein